MLNKTVQDLFWWHSGVFTSGGLSELCIIQQDWDLFIVYSRGHWGLTSGVTKLQRGSKGSGSLLICTAILLCYKGSWMAWPNWCNSDSTFSNSSSLALQTLILLACCGSHIVFALQPCSSILARPSNRHRAISVLHLYLLVCVPVLALFVVGTLLCSEVVLVGQYWFIAVTWSHLRGVVSII